MWDRIYENTGVGVGVGNGDRIERVNPSMAEMFGYPVDEMIGMDVHKLFLPENRDQVGEIIQRVNDVGYATFELDMLRRDGSRFPAVTTLRRIDDSGRRVSTIIDLTETRNVQARAAELEQMRSSLMESSPDYIMLLDPDGTIRYINRTVPDLTPERVRGRPVYEFMPESSEEAARHRFAHVLATGEPGSFETRYDAEDGGEHFFESRVSPVFQGDEIKALMVTARDVTAARQAERDLRAHAAQQRVVAELGTLATQTSEMSGLFTATVARVAETLGADCAEILELTRGGERLTVREQLGLGEEAIGMSAETDSCAFVASTVRGGEARVSEDLAADGIDLNCPILDQLGIVSGAAVPIEYGRRPWGVLAVYSKEQRRFDHHDTVFLRGVANLLGAAIDRHSSLLALADSERRYQQLFANINDIYFRATVHGTLIDVSPSVSKLVGVAREHLVGVDLSGFYVDGAIAASLGERLRATGELTDAEFGFKVPGRDRVEVSLTARLIRDPEGRPIEIEGIARDITRRQRLEERLRTAQKLEALGELAGGVAHDFNNLLTGIRGFADLVLAEMPEDHRWADDLRNVVRYSERAGKLTEQLLAFGRKQRMSPVVVDLNELLATTVQMLERVIGEHIVLELVAGEDAGHVRVDVALIEQALVNVALNARDAMPDGGTLRISTGAVDADRADAPAGLKPGRYASIRAADTGIGMDRVTRERIFEPFFTTKEIGRGTGLGLAMVYGIVRQHDGAIHVESSPGSGSCFDLYLPTVSGEDVRPVSNRSPETPEAAVPARGTERILLVEDEEAVRAVAAETLANLGYEVATAAEPDAAEELIRAGAEFDLLLADVVLPRRSGPEMFRDLRARDPGLRVLFISGYPDRALSPAARLSPDDPFLRKPFSPSELAGRVREVLDQPWPAETVV